MKIYIMRHAQTMQNAAFKVQGGASDSPLTKKGITKTLAAKKIIDTLGIQRIYSGDLGRHLQTVGLINVNHIEHIIDSNLNEANFGCFENKSLLAMYIKSFIKNRYLGNPRNLSINHIMDSLNKADPTSEVEDSRKINARIDKVMPIILGCNLDRVLIVSSGMFLETLIAKYNPSIRFMRMKNCGIYLLDSANGFKVSTVYE